MVTNKPQVLAYLHTDVYQRLAEFKQEHGIRSLSQAVEIVLSDYFGVAVPGIALPAVFLTSRTHLDNGESPLEEKVAVLANKYESLCEAIALIQKHTNLPADVTLSCQVEKSKGIRNLRVRHGNGENYQVSNGSVLTFEKLPVSLSEERVKKGLTGVALAERLNSYSSLISYKRSKPNFSFWTQEKDPDSIAWEYRSRTRRFHPIEVS
ncbi:MAG: hypothetical protein KME25_31485 [Symplocastrum torsivum CPER-KK1]|jgi:hypothetical protein|uniref:Uncharacterized protein n=1 Tax=Symplocastrum torsivum CPER-KK1 TaxID=450513 RepID=A0A951UDG1_9CYAN|nr:hypothetical protein [Symplocastrum torsivum CPER-KK1]